MIWEYSYFFGNTQMVTPVIISMVISSIFRLVHHHTLLEHTPVATFTNPAGDFSQESFQKLAQRRGIGVAIFLEHIQPFIQWQGCGKKNNDENSRDLDIFQEMNHAKNLADQKWQKMTHTKMELVMLVFLLGATRQLNGYLLVWVGGLGF